MNKPTMQIALCFAAVFMAAQLFAFRADEPVSGSAKGAGAVAAIKATPQKTPTDDQKEAVKSLDSVKVEWDAKTGAPASIRGKDLAVKNLGGKGLSLSPKKDFVVDAVAVMDRLTKAYRLRDAESELKPFKTEADELGFHHVRMNQMYQGLRVVGGQLIVHFNKSGQAYQVNGRYIPGIDIGIKAVIDANSAVEAAQRDLAQTGKPTGTLKGAAELVVYAQDISPLLAYELTLVYDDEKAGAGNWRYWINANDGTIINRYNDIHKTFATISGNLNWGEGGTAVSVPGDFINDYYRLFYLANHWAILGDNDIVRNSTANWPTNTDGRSEMSAAYNFNKVNVYYWSAHSRNGYDDSGATALVNLRTPGGTDNAFWSSTDKAFYFYPGSNWGELTVLDVCGHEFTHAVTDYTADLVYQDESGALNESFSDIFGAIIEFAYQPDGRLTYPNRTAGFADWLLGEDCTYPNSVALRDMRNPQRYNDPSKYYGTAWYYGTNDNGGVHRNSGVQNHFFYLLCEGGSGTNDGISYNITGIGVEKARQVAYRALTVYCTANTDYAAARGAWLYAAYDLDLAWVSAVRAAWRAVGIADLANALLTIGLNNDFDGDNIADYAIYNPYGILNGRWYIHSSLYGAWLAYDAIFGGHGYLPVPGDYNGDGKADVVVYSPSTAWWMIYYTDTGVADTFQWGGDNYIPAPGDYDGDDKTDFALHNYVTGAWYIFSSSTLTWLANGEVFGGYGYIPVPGDYKGDGISDVFVYSEDTGRWYLYYPETHSARYLDFGGPGYIPAPGDYDGDGVTDLGLYDYLYGYWYVWSPVNGWLVAGSQWGDRNYIPVAGDYDGDGISDIAVYSRYYGDWWIYYVGTGSNLHVPGFGGTQYVPITYWALYRYM